MSKHRAPGYEVVITTGELKRIIHEAVGGRHIPSIQPGVDYALHEIDFELDYLWNRPKLKGKHRGYSTGGDVPDPLPSALPLPKTPVYQIPGWKPWQDYYYDWQAPSSPYRVTC